MSIHRFLLCLVRLRTAALGGLIVVSCLSRAAETDDFPPAGGKIPASSAAELDHIVRDIFEQFVQRHNQSDPGCDKKQLMKAAIMAFDQNFSWAGRILEDHQDGKESNYKIGFSGSTEKSETVFKGTKVKGCCSRAINIDGVLIGIDKIDHFFGNGGILYDQYVALRERMDEDKALSGVMAISRKQEHGWWGLGTTGVKSYGDLAANWDGIRFFRDLFDGPNPYFSCQDGKLSIRRAFSIKDYVKPSWSESANCSAFADKKTSTTVSANLTARGLTCPVNSSDCDRIMKLYEGHPLELENLVSPVCRQHVKFEDSVEPVGKNDSTSIGIIFGGMNGNVIRQTIKDIFSGDSDGGASR